MNCWMELRKLNLTRGYTIVVTYRSFSDRKVTWSDNQKWLYAFLLSRASGVITCKTLSKLKAIVLSIKTLFFFLFEKFPIKLFIRESKCWLLSLTFQLEFLFLILLFSPNTNSLYFILFDFLSNEFNFEYYFLKYYIKFCKKYIWNHLKLKICKSCF